MTIRVIYHDGPPNFPATDQHPQAVRIQIGAVWVDYVGAVPTQADVDAILNAPPLPPPPDPAVLQQRITRLENSLAKAGVPLSS